MSLPTIPYDKALHFIYGAILAVLGALVCVLIGLPMWQGALVLPVLAGIGKELRDRWAEAGTPDTWDALATVAGALPTVIVAAVAQA